MKVKKLVIKHRPIEFYAIRMLKENVDSYTLYCSTHNNDHMVTRYLVYVLLKKLGYKIVGKPKKFDARTVEHDRGEYNFKGENWEFQVEYDDAKRDEKFEKEIPEYALFKSFFPEGDNKSDLLVHLYKDTVRMLNDCRESDKEDFNVTIQRVIRKLEETNAKS